MNNNCSSCKKSQEENQFLKRNFKFHGLVINITHAAMWAGILFCAHIGIKAFAQTSNKPLFTTISLYTTLFCLLAPSAGLVICGYFYLYNNSPPKKEEYVKVNLKFTKNANWGTWLKEHVIEYNKEPEILKRRLGAWGIHLVALIFYSFVYYLSRKGIVSIITENIPKPEWHTTIITSLSILSFIILAIIDTIFFYSLYKMMWHYVPEKEYNKEEKNHDNNSEIDLIQASTSLKGGSVSAQMENGNAR